MATGRMNVRRRTNIMALANANALVPQGPSVSDRVLPRIAPPSRGANWDLDAFAYSLSPKYTIPEVAPTFDPFLAARTESMRGVGRVSGVGRIGGVDGIFDSALGKVTGGITEPFAKNKWWYIGGGVAAVAIVGMGVAYIAMKKKDKKAEA